MLQGDRLQWSARPCWVAGLCRAAKKRGLKVRAVQAAETCRNNAAVADIPGDQQCPRRRDRNARNGCRRSLAVSRRASHMNPVLLKPQTDVGAQVVVQGQGVRRGGRGRRDLYQAMKRGA